jgi:hypothetical protein
MPIPFTVGFLLIYALAAGVLLRHLTFWSLRFEALAHYYLISLFTVSSMYSSAPTILNTIRTGIGNCRHEGSRTTMPRFTGLSRQDA